MRNLTDEDKALLLKHCQVFSVRNSGKKIKNQFAVYSDFNDDAGFTFDGQLPRAVSGETVTEFIDGLAWPAGYDEFSNLAFLQVIDGADSETTKTTLKCDHAENYDILAQARLDRSRVRYSGYRTSSALGKKEHWILSCVELVASDIEGSEHFELTS
jgi:hypothetical protein